MKNHAPRTSAIAAILGVALACTATVFAEAEAEAPAAEAKLKILVLVPEQIDVERFWYFYTTDAQFFVQAAIEKKLLRAGHEVIDLSSANPAEIGEGLKAITEPASALDVARKLGATHVITGQAIATSAGESVAYGVPVHRATASVVTKVLRASDGNVLAVEEATAEAGAQAARAAGQEALKELGKSISKNLARAVSQLEPSN